MATRIEKTDLARDALYDKVNTMIDEVNTKIDNKDSLPSQTGNSGKFLTTDGTNASWGEVKQIEIKQDLTNPTIDTVPSTKAVSDESSRITTLMNTKVSNCITEIPQDIKLELNNGTLTLKAGSKVYVPNGKNADGSNKFDVVTIESDKVWSSRNLDYPQQFIFLTPSQGFEAVGESGGTVHSGATAPSGKQFMLWYDTTNNFIKWTTDSGSTWVSGCSFALSICSSTQANNWASIDQVFNGFGYIGNWGFVLPDVEVLIPNGRNSDGSLNNIKYKTQKVYARKIQYGANTLYFWLNMNDYADSLFSYEFFIQENMPTSNARTQWYKPSDNKIYFKESGSSTWTQYMGIPVFSNYGNDNGVTSFTPKTVFHALDYNDKSTISGWSMPSSRYIDLTLGADGSRYTAPANGWFAFAKRASAAGQFFNVTYISPAKITFWSDVGAGGVANILGHLIPVQKGQIVMISYNAGGDIIECRFIYAEGE